MLKFSLQQSVNNKMHSTRNSCRVFDSEFTFTPSSVLPTQLFLVKSSFPLKYANIMNLSKLKVLRELNS